MRQVIYDSEIYALILTADDFQPGAKFISKPEWRLQVGLMTLLPGDAIAPHAHLPQDVPQGGPTQECIFVICGRMEVDFFDGSGLHFHTEVVRQGEALFQIRGGHGFRFLEETCLIDVKSGPYRGRAKDKVRLEASTAASFLRSKESGGRVHRNHRLAAQE